MHRPSRLRRVLRWLLLAGFVVGLLLAAAIAGYMRYLDTTITRTFEGRRWSVPAVIYAQPVELYPGALLSVRSLGNTLERLGYRAVTGRPQPGAFSRSGDAIDIHLRAFPFPDQPRDIQRIRVRFQNEVILEITDSDGRMIPIIALDPAAIGSFFPSHGEDRIVLAPDQVPTLLTETLKAVEDQNFDSHFGFDPLGILRAFWANLRAGEVQQGGSTLTQQLVKSFYLSNRRTLERKLREVGMAIILDYRFSKEEMLNAFINEIFLGQDGRRAVHGFGLGAQFYFNKPIDELAPEEIALLIAVIRGPSYYNPYRHPERALARRNFVLNRMLEYALISPEAHARAVETELRVARGTRLGATYYPAYMDLVRRGLADQYREQDLTSSGLRIFTNLNPLVQERVEQSLAVTLGELEQARGLKPNTLQGAAVVRTIQTGEIIAVAGGRIAGFDGFNRALDASRPIGSLIKPVIYLKALESGYHLASMVDDAPITRRIGNQTWSPRNYDKRIHGPVPIVRALGDSLNLATVRLGLDLGVEAIADRVEDLSGHRVTNRYPSLLLGAETLTPLEVAALFGTIANSGFRAQPKAVITVTDANGQALSQRTIEGGVQRIAPDAASGLIRGMQAVMRYGTGRGSPFARSGVAGKTGTTDDYRDSWFVGFDNMHLVVVWIGTDDNQPTRLSGATGALRVWNAIMAGLPVQPIVLPPANSTRIIDYDTGLEADASCSREPVEIDLPANVSLRPLPGCNVAPPSALERIRSWLGDF
jgi:penicillin-binding protein 1B